MMRFYALAVVTLAATLMLAACAGETSEPVRDTPASPDADTSVAERPASPAQPVDLPAILAADERAPGVDTLAVIDQLPEPQRVEEKTRENRHMPGAVDTLRTYHYDGLTFTVVFAANDKELLQEVRVTGEGYETEQGLRVGLPRAEVQQMLGQSTRTEDGVAVYEMGDEATDVLRVRYQNDRVAELAWNFYID